MEVWSKERKGIDDMSDFLDSDLMKYSEIHTVDDIMRNLSFEFQKYFLGWWLWRPQQKNFAPVNVKAVELKGEFILQLSVDAPYFLFAVFTKRDYQMVEFKCAALKKKEFFVASQQDPNQHEKTLTVWTKCMESEERREFWKGKLDGIAAVFDSMKSYVDLGPVLTDLEQFLKVFTNLNFPNDLETAHERTKSLQDDVII